MKKKKSRYIDEKVFLGSHTSSVQVISDVVVNPTFSTYEAEEDMNKLSLDYFLDLKKSFDDGDSTLEVQNIEAIINKNLYFKKRRFYHFVKRIFDIFSSLIMIILLSPILLFIALLIKIDSKGPVFYKHKRLGKKGKTFKMLKFRSMRQDDRPLEEQLTPEQYREFIKEFKLDNDPRITKVGKFLRKTSLDELPQLFNILGGSMSFVGPRPIIDKELDKYGQTVDVLLCVKPGLTSYWASHGRSNVDYDERVNMELYYVKHRSFWFDFKILVATFVQVLKRKGAK